jgi:hypothetical protein
MPILHVSFCAEDVIQNSSDSTESRNRFFIIVLIPVWRNNYEYEKSPVKVLQGLKHLVAPKHILLHRIH